VSWPSKAKGVCDGVYYEVYKDCRRRLKPRTNSCSLQKLVSAEISKNLATHDISEIRKHLPERF